MRRADEARVLRQHAIELAPRRLRPPALELGAAHQQLEPPARRVDADAITILYQRDRPACGRLGRDIADHHAARRAGEAAVGKERHLLAHSLAVDQRRDAEHLAHARTALRAFVADDEDLARLIGATL